MRCLQNKEDEWKWNPIFSTGLVSLIHFSRGPAPCQDHTSKGTGESVFPGSRADVLHFLCCLCAASSKPVKLGGGMWIAVQLPPQPSPGPLNKPVEAWALGEQASPTARLRTGDDPPLLRLGTRALRFAESCCTIFPPTISHDSMASCLQRAEFLYVFFLVFHWRKSSLFNFLQKATFSSPLWYPKGLN